MDRKKRFTVVFTLLTALVAVAVCVGLTFGLIRLIGWYLRNCGTATTSPCVVADFTIDYWWAVFIPLCLLVAWALRMFHDHRYSVIESQE